MRALLALVLVTAACKGKDADAPPPTGTGSAPVAPTVVPSEAPAPAGNRQAIVTVGDPALMPESSLSTASVKAKLQQVYSATLQRCLRAAATADAPPTDSLELSFTVNDAGRVVEPSAYGATKEAADCVAAAMNAWAFPIPKGPDLTPMSVTAKVIVEIVYQADTAPDAGVTVYQ